jgi:hypothetical protein
MTSNKMSNRFSDQDVLNLLTGLKNAENAYPPEMIQSRRESYAKQAAAMAVLLKASHNTSGTGSTVSNSPLSNTLAKLIPHAGKVIEIVLVSAIALEALAVAYVYRDQISDFLNDIFSSQVANSTEDLTSPSLEAPGMDDSTTADTAELTIMVTVTEEPTATPNIPANSNTDNNGDGSEDGQISSTPEPKENPGNHYGNTPKPDQPNTKDDESSKEKNNK